MSGTAAVLAAPRTLSLREFFNLFKTSDTQPGAPNGVLAWFMQPDANVGGPVLIPKLYNGRNKTFFFFGYQKLIEKKAAGQFGTVPTPAMKAGDFSFGGLGNPIFDPTTTRQLADGTWVRDPFPGNIIPANRFDPVAQRVLEIDPWKAPNTTGTFNSDGPVDNL